LPDDNDWLGPIIFNPVPSPASSGKYLENFNKKVLYNRIIVISLYQQNINHLKLKKMGTRSTYRVIEQYKNEAGSIEDNNLVLVYRQYDGYPTGHPLETAGWLATGTVVNGLGMTEERLVFNGAGCLAAQLIARFKDGPGGTYIHSLDSRGQSWEDYLYDIIVKEDRTIEFVCYENDETPNEIFRGTPAEFVAKYEKVEA
jgi:hypothetical protein